MSETSNLQLPFLAAGQAQKHVTVNETLLRLDALVQLAVVSASTSAQPGSPSDGETYILPSGKTGADWGGMANGAIAYYRDGVWEEVTSKDGFLAYVKDRDECVAYNGAAWERIASAVSRIAGVCDGRLTLESGVPISSSDQSAKTLVYFTPFRGEHIGLYGTDGAWRLYVFAETAIKLTNVQTGTLTSGATSVTGLGDTSQLIVGMGVSGTGVSGGTTVASITSATSITLSTNATASGAQTLTFTAPTATNFDIFGYESGGALKLELLKWTDDVTRATAFAWLDGVRVKSGDSTRRLLGTVRTSAAGQTEMKFGAAATGGSPASLLLANAQNQVATAARVLETTGNWSYGTNTIRPYNNSSGNRISFVQSVKDFAAEAAFNAACYSAAATRSGTGGIGLDTTTAFSSTRFFVYGAAGAIQTACSVAYRPGPLLGFHYLQALECANAGANVTFYGGAGLDEALEATLWL